MGEFADKCLMYNVAECMWDSDKEAGTVQREESQRYLGRMGK